MHFSSHDGRNLVEILSSDAETTKGIPRDESFSSGEYSGECVNKSVNEQYTEASGQGRWPNRRLRIITAPTAAALAYATRSDVVSCVIRVWRTLTSRN